MSNGSMIFKFLLLSVISSVVYSNVISSNETYTDRSQLRTLAIIEQRADTGRLVLLICGKHNKCRKPRTEIPEWIRDFNEHHKYAGKELIHYHFYVMGPPLPILNKLVTEFPTLVYIIAKTPHYYRGDISDQDAVKAWLEVLDEVTISKPKDFEQVTRIFQDVSGENCDSKYLLMLNNEKKCPFPNWPILARQVESKHQIRPAEIFAPITTDTKVALYRRMPHLPQTLCRTLILLTQGSYSFLPDILSIAEISDWLEEHFPSNSSECGSLLETVWLPLRPPLTELELIFFSGEHELVVMEHNWLYICIGVMGGLAVCTLAFSIFWGLNGNAFTR